MPQKPQKTSLDAWTLDQLAKSTFFHRKLHEWRLVEISDQINEVQGENLNWENLNISPDAWNKIIHRGIKPVIVFAHPYTLQTILGSVGYYRMLAMVSQKSMKRVGLNLESYELTSPLVNDELSLDAAQHLNRIISILIEADEMIDAREFDLWRGMAAGSQAQGSWQNNKGASAEIVIRELILGRLKTKDLLTQQNNDTNRLSLSDGRTLSFSKDPDVSIHQGEFVQVAIEIKGGIDTAAVLERIGATLKSLRRIRLENSQAITILILPDVSITARSQEDLGLNTETVTHMFGGST